MNGKETRGNGGRGHDVSGVTVSPDLVPQKGKEAGDVKAVGKRRQDFCLAAVHPERPCVWSPFLIPNVPYGVCAINECTPLSKSLQKYVNSSRVQSIKRKF